MKVLSNKMGALLTGVVLVFLSVIGCSSQLREDDKRARWDYMEAVSAYSSVYVAKHTDVDSELVNAGGGSYGKTGNSIEMADAFQFKSESPILQATVVSSLIAMYQDMEVFALPATSSVSETHGSLAGAEGQIEVRSRWYPPTDESRDAAHTLWIEQSIQFSPKIPPTEKQDTNRLPSAFGQARIQRLKNKVVERAGGPDG